MITLTWLRAFDQSQAAFLIVWLSDRSNALNNTSIGTPGGLVKYERSSYLALIGTVGAF